MKATVCYISSFSLKLCSSWRLTVPCAVARVINNAASRCDSAKESWSLTWRTCSWILALIKDCWLNWLLVVYDEVVFNSLSQVSIVTENNIESGIESATHLNRIHLFIKRWLETKWNSVCSYQRLLSATVTLIQLSQRKMNSTQVSQ